MSVELTFLTLTLILAASLWIPYIVGVNSNDIGDHDPFDRPPPLTAYPAWVHRAHRAHLNMIEAVTPFAGVVLIAHVTQVSTAVTSGAAGVFFVVRVLHAIGMISGKARFPTRPTLFVVGWLCTLVIGVQVLVA